MSTHSAIPQESSHLHTWCTPLFPCLKTYTQGGFQDITNQMITENTLAYTTLVIRTYLHRWHKPDDRAHKSFCGRCNKSLGCKSSDTCFLEDWKGKQNSIYKLTTKHVELLQTKNISLSIKKDPTSH